MFIISLFLTPSCFIVLENQYDLIEQWNTCSIERNWENVNLLYEGQYHNSIELENEIQNMQQLVPDLVDVEIIGQSYLGKDIISIRITNKAIEMQKAKALVVAHHHGREQITVEIALRFILRLLNLYGVDETITEYLDTEEIYVIPTINPDALDVVVNEGNNWLRKNLRPYDDDDDGFFDEDSPQDVDGDGIISWFDVYLREGESSDPVFSHSYFEGIDDDLDGLVNEDHIGLVDPNRNYDVFWNTTPSKLSEPSSSTYAGPAPFSEPETQAFRDFALQHKFAMAYSLHSGINSTFLAVNQQGQFAETALYTEILNDFAQLLPIGYNTGWSYNGSDEMSRNLASATVSGVWREWMYYQRATLAPIAFEVYTNATCRGAEVESMYVDNETHYIVEWKGIFGYFNPTDEYIDSLWLDLIPSFDYLLEMTPRVQVQESAATLDEDDSSIAHISIDALCLGKRIDTINPIKIDLSNGTTVYSDILSRGNLTEIGFEVSTEGILGENLHLIIGNEYVGYEELTIPIPAVESSTDIFILIGIAAIGVCAVLILVVFIKKKLLD